MFKQAIRSGLVAALLATGLAAAHAEGFYAGGSLGSPDYRTSVNGISGNGSGVGGKVYGGYELTPNFSVEGGFADLGHIDDASGRVDLRGVFVDAVGHYEVAPKWSVYGSAGVAQGQFKTTAGQDSSPALKLGVGVEYDLTDRVGLRAGYDHYAFSDAFDAKPRVGELSFGLQVGF